MGSLTSFKWRIGEEQKGLGLSRALSLFLKIPADEACDLIDFGAVFVKGRVERNPSMILAGREEISVTFPPRGTRRFYEIEPGRIIFRDRFLLAYDKEAGIPSQQVPYDAYNNVFAALLRYLAKERNPAPYAAMHHRLDKETSGVLLFALEKRANKSLSLSFRERRVKKEYLAWVEGSPREDSWMSDMDIGKVGGEYKAVRQGEGKEARTVFRVLRREESRTLVLAEPLTGRTHQIRIHLAESGHPIQGDRSYGAKPDRRLYLHARRLTLKHPVYRTPVILESPAPEDMIQSEG
jgi:23S rRNA pseudouridine1911/1915/1917 synthase